MSTARRLVRNILSLAISRPISKVAGFFASVWLVRYLGRKSLGILDTALGFVSLFSYVSDFGTQHFVTREISRDRNTTAAYLSGFLSFQALFGILLFVVIVVLVNALGYDLLIKQAIYLAGAGLVVMSMSAPFKAVFHAHEAIHISAFLSVALALTGALVTVGGILVGGGVRLFAAISIIGAFTVVGIGYAVCRERFAVPRFAADPVLWWRMLKMSFPFALLMGATVIHTKIDIQMLYIMKGKTAVGYYSAVGRFIHPLMTVSQDVMAAMYPVLSRRYVTSDERFRFLAVKTLKYVAALGFPMALGAFLLSDKIVLLLYGHPFRASIPTLQILSWTLATSSLIVVITYSLVASGRVVMLAVFHAVAALSDVLLNALLIPAYSFNGAALSTVGCQVLLVGVLVWYMRRGGVSAFPWRDVAKVASAAASMAGFVLLCRGASIFVIVPAAVLIYVAALLLLRFVEPEERELLMSVFRPK